MPGNAGTRRTSRHGTRPPQPSHAPRLVRATGPTRDGIGRARWIAEPRDNFDWTDDPTRQGQQKRRLYLLCDGRPAGHAVAVEARWICACGDNGSWRTNQIDVSRDAETHALRHKLATTQPSPGPQTTGALP